MSEEYLTLKWGSLKSWNFEGNDKCIEALKEYFDQRVKVSAIAQHDTLKQKELICKMIDEVNAETIYLDWDDKDVSKEEAKQYVLDYER